MLNQKTSIDEFFLISTEDFGLGGVVVFSTMSEDYKRYQADALDFEQHVLDIVSQMSGEKINY